jgi:hypothetical protein
MAIKIDTKLEKEIDEYCKLNEIEINKFANNILKNGFMIEKYGERPSLGNKYSLKTVKKVISYSFSLPVVEKEEEIKEIATEGVKKIKKVRKLV